jgi:hypothetical protein
MNVELRSPDAMQAQRRTADPGSWLTGRSCAEVRDYPGSAALHFMLHRAREE